MCPPPSCTVPAPSHQCLPLRCPTGGNLHRPDAGGSRWGSGGLRPGPAAGPGCCRRPGAGPDRQQRTAPPAAGSHIPCSAGRCAGCLHSLVCSGRRRPVRPAGRHGGWRGVGVEGPVFGSWVQHLKPCTIHHCPQFWPPSYFPPFQVAGEAASTGTGALVAAAAVVDPQAPATTLPIGASGASVTLPAGFAAALPSGVQLRLAHTADASLLLTLVTSSSASVPATTASTGRALLAAAPTMDGALSVTVVSGECVGGGGWASGAQGGCKHPCMSSAMQPD